MTCRIRGRFLIWSVEVRAQSDRSAKQASANGAGEWTSPHKTLGFQNGARSDFRAWTDSPEVPTTTREDTRHRPEHGYSTVRSRSATVPRCGMRHCLNPPVRVASKPQKTQGLRNVRGSIFDRGPIPPKCRLPRETQETAQTRAQSSEAETSSDPAIQRSPIRLALA